MIYEATFSNNNQISGEPYAVSPLGSDSSRFKISSVLNYSDKLRHQ